MRNLVMIMNEIEKEKQEIINTINKDGYYYLGSDMICWDDINPEHIALWLLQEENKITRCDIDDISEEILKKIETYEQYNEYDSVFIFA